MTTSLDHPRVRGEKAHADPTHLWRAGSPPRVRGKVSAGGRDARQPGITPACAGKRSSCASTRLVARDHPRVCGEKRPCRARKMQGAGSPPRVRGKVALPAKPPELFGITPACAGKSITPSGATNRNEDHPRVCGEKLIAVSPQTSTLGSPPRVRGKGACAERVPRNNRITPACAGKRCTAFRRARFCRDHPRVCGER